MTTSIPDRDYSFGSGVSMTSKLSQIRYTRNVISKCQTRVKLNRVFFPRRFCQARSLGCGFAP